ncbi:hypothetical protein IF651_12780 [Cellulosimicrobium arenosum]|uniref:Uncharacterized protein n=1 Tax=Cellulosimicrobium arenosum TaxID=2708133 RepID=A0A927J144_9MICO|nr:hypothetical protein [Cellulosimicrobium arenosum]
MPDLADELATELDRLYALPLEQFVVARTAAARRVKASGDAVGAARVARLTKPTVAAWVVNQVARSHPDQVAALVTLGDELRTATTDRDRGRITALDRLRRERTDALVGEVRSAGEVAGRAVSAGTVDRLAETLTAAVMDPDAGALVRSGRLGQALQHVGFGIVDEGGEPADVVTLRDEVAARRSRTRGTTSTGDAGADADADPVAEAEREVAETAAEVDRLEAARDEADARVREAGDVVGQVEDELGTIEDELARLADERDAARARLADANDARARAQDALATLDDELDTATDRAAAARKARRAARPPR